MKRSSKLFFVSILVAVVAAAAAPAVEVSIGLADRQIFYPDSEIRVRVTITNDTAEPYRFKLADRRLFSVDFDVRTLANRPVERSREFTTRRAADQAIFYREVTIEPGEEYRFTEPLDRFVEIPGPGTYVMTGRFYPELYSRAGSRAVTTNRLTFSVRPSPAGVPEVAARIDEETREILRRERIPPDEVVHGTIEARQRENWNRFFLYMDLESLLKIDPARERRYRALSEEERREEIERFREHLRSDVIDEDIVTRPDTFEIRETRYTQTEATVETIQRFEFPQFTEVREYTYRLQRRDDIWIIYDYSVENLGAE